MNMLILDTVRTPRGRGSDKGSLKGLKPAELLAQVFDALAARNRLDTASVPDAVIGCVTQTGAQGGNVARMAALVAGWSDAMSAMTLNRLCASGLSAVNFAALQAGDNDSLAVGGGVEMMSRVPMASDRGPLTHDGELQARAGLVPIGIAADLVATLRGYSREDCDQYAFDSQQRAARAREQGYFTSMIPVKDAAGTTLLAQDETIRAGTTREALAAMQPAFAGLGATGIDAAAAQRLGTGQVSHVHHAGNSPATADGASLVLLGTEAAAKRAGLRPRARIVAMADAGADRYLALTGAVDATRKALAKAGLAARQVGLFEVNESFAALMLHYMDDMGIERARLNVNGGAIALGHAMGSTGSALVGTLLDELERRDERYGVVSICGAAGVAVATVIERLQ